FGATICPPTYWRSMPTKNSAACGHRMRDTVCTLGSPVLNGVGWSRKHCWLRIPSVAGASALSLPGKLVTIHSLTTTVPFGPTTTLSSQVAWRNMNVRIRRVESCSACSMQVDGQILVVFLNCFADWIVVMEKVQRFIL